jgi:hypothetical protein
VAPAARDLANAGPRWALLKRNGSTSAVLSGAVRGVEYVRARAPPAWMPDAVSAARHASAPRTVRQRAVTPTAGHASGDRSRPSAPFRTSYLLARESGTSENASDFPEPGAIARSQSVFAVFSLTVARKIPKAFARTRATVRHAPLLP